MRLVHIYCGDGKGKTSAAVGSAIRFVGHDGKVLFCQFMKSGNSGELSILNTIPNITVQNPYKIKKFSFDMTEEEKKETAKGYLKQFNELVRLLNNEKYGMVVMDEIMSCISCGFISTERIIEFLENRSQNIEVIMTGRNPDKNLIKYADYVSEICKVKHPYDEGIIARKGIEY